MSHQLIELKEQDQRWCSLLKKGLHLAEEIEFNVLYSYPGKELNIFLEEFNGRLITPSKEERFYFDHKRRISIPKSEKISDLMLSKHFEDWNGSLVEDPALIYNGLEIIGSITHHMLCQFDDQFFDSANLS
ncbi:hypothetical protein [Neolewinella persica]|uniref:hypothetical protein n=1 Tax=Neolewinella persica TaxID=70998 RepID=UPI00037415DA|nr:hypothetical protein [Neolewinella persica]